MTSGTALIETPADDLAERRIRLFVVIAVVAAIAVLAVYLLAVRTAPGQRFDDIAFDGRAVEDPEITATTNDLLHTVTRSSLFLLTAGIVVIALARRRVRLALSAGVAITASVVTTEVLKLHVLDRPDLDGISGIAQNSYPSGHATIGMSLSLGIVMVAPHRWRWVAAAVALVLATGFGIGVLATGWHRPSDTFGAYAVCTAVFAAVTAILLRWRGAGTADQRAMGGVEERLSPRVAVAIGALALLAGAIALVSTFQADSLRTVEFAADYLAVCAGILLTAALVVLGYHQLLRGVSLDAPRHDDT